MKNINTTSHRAIAMIELIFAIVIMGIVMMGMPMLVSTATKSGYVALQQESIAATSTEIGMILTRHWDEADTDENQSAPILITNGDNNLNESNITGNLARVRWGTPQDSKRNFLASLGGRLTATTPANLGDDAGDRDDIDDFDSLESNLSEEESSAFDGDYIDKNIKLTTTVYYISDTPTSGSYLGAGNSLTVNFTTGVSPNSTNIKLVEVNLTTTSTQIELDKTIVLKAFSCNIGTYELEERVF